MGIYGFGSLRDKFTRSLSHLERYVVCFDITPLVVHAIRHSETPAEFRRSLARRLETSNEILFLRKHPPLELCYSLDNRSPRAKRQTQLRRVNEAQSAVSRIRSNSNGCRTNLRISDVARDVRRILLTRYSLGAKRVYFDHDEGEGEIKAINWLSSRDVTSTRRVIMSRDNDVYVYVLARMMMTTTSADVLDGTNIGSRDDNDYDRILVFHESSRDVLSCWDDLSAHRARAWVFVLWLSICFGNDYAHGILGVSIDSLRFYFARLYASFVRDIDLFAAYRDDLFSTDGKAIIVALNSLRQALTFVEHEERCRVDSDARFRNCASATMRIWMSLRVRKYNDQKRARLDHQKKSANEGVCDDERKDNNNVPTGKRDENEKDDDDVEERQIDIPNVFDPIVPRTIFDIVELRSWLARHMWSLGYAIETPSSFTRHERFRCFPSIEIDSIMDMPYISRNAFLAADMNDIEHCVRSIVQYGVHGVVESLATATN